MINYIEKQLPLANKRKVEFIFSIIVKNINENRKYKILDVGCGTGELFTIPLAVRLQKFGNIKILGIDIHSPSIERAKEHVSKLALKNLIFECKSIDQINGVYDYVSLLETLEHLEEPEVMLAEVKKRVKQDGFFILSIPNGIGPFEIESAIFRVFKKSKLPILLKSLFKFLKKIKRYLILKNSTENNFLIRETLNDSNNIHIQFFTFNRIEYMLIQKGFRIVKVLNVNFLSGPFSRFFFLHFKFITKINLKISDYLPHIMSSGWVFISKIHSDDEK